MSSNPLVRRMMCEFAIGMMVCTGGYYFLVSPARSAETKVRAQIEQAQRQAAGTPGVAALTDDQVRELQRVTAEQAHEIATRSAPARDEAAMFGAVMELAGKHNVRVDQLQPNASGNAHAAQPAAPVTPPEPGALPPPKDTRAAYTISTVSNYSDLAGFLNSLQNRLGYTVVRSVRATPAGNETPDLIHAVIETDHFAFDLVGVSTGKAMTNIPSPPTAAATQPE